MTQRLTASNTFTQGMISDISDLNISNAATISALNATLSTFNGNEGVLQNDMGNCKITSITNEGEQSAKFPENMIPVGSIEFGGVVYYALLDKNGKMCEIGSFPSPDYDLKQNSVKGKLLSLYQPLHVGYNKNSTDIPLRTTLFNFNLEHPVTMLAEKSFDGSVNLILNDGLNTPKLINTGFHVQDGGNYEIIERFGTNNTNRYNITDEDAFKIETSLYKDITKLSRFQYNGTQPGGQLQVGNYVFYAVSCDKDGNESDIICESGVVSVFFGTDGDPFSVKGGISNERTDKSIKLQVVNVDSCYKYLKIFYTRTTAGSNETATTLAYKIDKLFPVTSANTADTYKCDILITGFETIEDVPIQSLNIQYFNANSAKTASLNQNILFLANVQQKNGNDSNEYEYLRKNSLCIYPTLDISKKLDLNPDYSSSEEKNNYYNSKFIYNTTGYHAEEYYRFGIVYIRQDGSHTSVFDILGINNLERYEKIPKIYTDDSKYDSFTYQEVFYNLDGYNNKGVCKIDVKDIDLKDIIGIRMTFSNKFDMANIATKYKGFFFVRQKRIPTILGQGYTTNVCEESYLPSITLYDNGERRYLYESFATTALGTFNSGDIDTNPNYFPKKGEKGGNLYYLRNNYNQRLFTLTDHTWGYFDKLPNNNPILYYWKMSSYDVEGYWLSGSYMEIYGPNDDDYLMIVGSDGIGESVDHDYHVKSWFFTKIDSVQNSSLYNECVNDFNQEKYSAGGGFYRDGQRYPGGYPSAANPDKPMETENKFSYYVLDYIKAFCDYYSNDIQYEYGKGHFNRQDVKLIGGKVTKKDWYYKTPKWIKVGNSYYKYFLGLHDGKYKYARNMSGHIRGAFCDYSARKSSEITKNQSNMTTGAGLDLEVSTFNGKYQYYDKTRGIDNAAIKCNPMEYGSYAVFFPEGELNAPYYNSIFTGQKVITRPVCKMSLKSLFKRLYAAYGNIDKKTKKENLTMMSSIDSNGNSTYYRTNAINVDENVSLISLQHGKQFGKEEYIKRHIQSYFSTKAGNQNEVSFKFTGHQFLAYSFPTEPSTNQNLESNTAYRYYKVSEKHPFNMVRGIYGKYIGIYPYKRLQTRDGISESAVENYENHIVNFYIPGYTESNHDKYLEMRADDSSKYYAISDSYDFGSLEKINTNYYTTTPLYRGDCYISYYTHRINRNFQDSVAPYNDVVINPSSFKDGFDGCFDVDYRKFDNSKEDAKKFNLGDLNAVQLGSWITFPIRSTMNICLRTSDESIVAEKLQSGNARSFYPLHPVDASGSYKLPESNIFNVGFNKSGGERQYQNINQNTWIDTYYRNRILYSNILQNGSTQNGHRVFLQGHYRDYTDQYGEIVKLIELSGNLLVVCEHGIMLISVNERALAGEGTGGFIYINTSNVLPENPRIISDTYGSKFPESVIKTPYGVFGIDESSKKIWFTDGSSIRIISDYKIQKFLNENLDLDSIKIGQKNIKTHYNAYKNDVMFTLYNITNDYKETPDKLWNICWNINQNNWITYYSWIPIDSSNIGNSYLSINLLDYITYNKETKIPYLWKHGQSNRIITTEQIRPTYWYGEQHPFEFEFIVHDHPDIHKIFNNLQIISNKAKPESFHYEIIGECFDFANDKQNAYKRQELTKKVYSDLLNSSISYKNVNDIQEILNPKSVTFPLYYYKLDLKNLIYDSYKNITCKPTYDYDALSGTELVKYPDLDEYRLQNHVKAVDVRDQGGLLRGNMNYLEDRWLVQITPINLLYKNEYWKTKIPLAFPTIKINDGNDLELSDQDFEKKLISSIGYTIDNISYWNIANRQEIKLKDKYIKIKVRYKGNELALINQINTLYQLSYT